MDERLGGLARSYRRWGEEARGRSDLWLEVVEAIAEDPEILAILAELPRPKQQPNLILAAVKYLCGVPRDYADFRRLFLAHEDEALALMLARRTQTNEPARCATLLPALAALPQPLALLEVGASAGLCLIPDRYHYDFDGHAVAANHDRPAPTFHCDVNAATPLPDETVEVAWRAGLDLAPVDVTDPDDVKWLQALVWPGEGERERLLTEALEVAREDPPPITQGDLLTDLPALAAQAPPEATLVIFHTAVLAYVRDRGDREAFAATVSALPATWLANEGPGVISRDSDEPWPSGSFVLMRDGEPIAATDPHGTSIEWLDGYPHQALPGARR